MKLAVFHLSFIVNVTEIDLFLQIAADIVKFKHFDLNLQSIKYLLFKLVPLRTNDEISFGKKFLKQLFEFQSCQKLILSQKLRKSVFTRWWNFCNVFEHEIDIFFIFLQILNVRFEKAVQFRMNFIIFYSQSAKLRWL